MQNIIPASSAAFLAAFNSASSFAWIAWTANSSFLFLPIVPR